MFAAAAVFSAAPDATRETGVLKRRVARRFPFPAFRVRNIFVFFFALLALLAPRCNFIAAASVVFFFDTPMFGELPAESDACRGAFSASSRDDADPSVMLPPSERRAPDPAVCATSGAAIAGGAGGAVLVASTTSLAFAALYSATMAPCVMGESNVTSAGAWPLGVLQRQ